MKLFSLFFFCFTLITQILAGDIKGFVYDKSSKEQLVGVSVILDNAKYGTTTSLDGSFLIKDVPSGKYKITISYVGYRNIDTLVITNEQNNNFKFYLEENVSNLSTVTVTARANGESELYAKKREQTLESIANIVSANAISISPDVTVANAIQRVSGISVQRSGYGEGQYAIIRGMDKKYNTTLVNGIKIPSPDNRDRFVPLDMFPSELLERMEVYKSLTPSMEADATGGVVNLVMKNAPEKFKVDANIGAGFSQLFLDRPFQQYNTDLINPKSPAEVRGVGVYATPSDFPYQNLIVTPLNNPLNTNASLTIGSRFLNNKLGVVFSGSNQSSYKGSNSIVFVQTATIAPGQTFDSQLNQTFSDTEVREYSSKIDRSGVMSKIDYAFDPENSISLFATYLQLNERRARLTTDSLLGGYDIKGYVGSYAVSYKTQTQSNLQGIYSATLQGKNKLTDHFKMEWSLVASQAKKELPDVTQYDITKGINPDVNAGTYTVGPLYVQKENHEWQHNTDKDFAGYLNFRYTLPQIGYSAPILGFGGLYRHKDRDNYDNRYSLTPVSDPGDIQQAYKSLSDSKFTFIPSTGALGSASENPGIYTFKEDVAAGYGQIKYGLTRRLELLGGLRVENTSQSYTTALPVTIAGKTGAFSFLGFLPSIQLKDSLNLTSALRFSYFRSIYRPAFADKIPFYDRSANDNFATVGNPNLQHTIIENLDARYEVFGNGLDQFMVGTFFKYIQNPIEFVTEQLNNSAELILTPDNVGNARNIGFEVVFRKYVGSFGVSGNYTYTNSEIASPKAVYYRLDGGGTTTAIVSEKRPLQGQSAHIGNFSLLFKNTKLKIDAQLSLVYTGERISSLSLYRGLDNWEKATTNLDFSIQKQFGKHCIIYGKANNLLNTPYELIIKQQNFGFSGTNKLPFQESADYRTVELDKFYASYSIGIRLKY